MNWDDVRLFHAVAESGTLAEAATQLGVSAPTLHRRMAALERQVEATLFERSPRGYQLTAVGEAALPQAESVAESVASFRRTITGHDREARGTVRLSVPPGLISVVAPVLAAFRASCPQVVVDLRVSGQLVDLGTDADVALRIAERPPLDAIARRLGVVPWGRYRNEHADDDAAWVHLAGFADVPAVRAWQPDGAAAFQTGSVAEALALIDSGPFQCCLPAFLGEAAPLARRVGPLHPDRRLALWLLIHVDLRRSARVRALVDDLVQRLVPEAVVGLHA